jgi:hypothetical protein
MIFKPKFIFGDRPQAFIPVAEAYQEGE